MADFPLVPGSEDQVASAAPPPPMDVNGLASRWQQWIDNPGNRAALIQTGLALSQPISAGQNVLGHIGQAVGQGGEASDRIRRQGLEEEELASKQDLRAAQGELAGARAENAGVRAGAATERLTNQAERLRLIAEGQQLRANVALMGQYGKYKEAFAKQNLINGTTEKPLEFEDWVAANPTLATMVTGGSTGGVVKVTSPAEAQKLKPGTRYQTPDGRTFTR